MRHHNSNNRGLMAAVSLGVLGIFWALHLALPGVTLWPATLVSTLAATVIVSHIRRSPSDGRAVATIHGNRNQS